MASRPVFEVYDKPPFFRKRDVDFQFFNGFSMEQKKRSCHSLHDAYLQWFPSKKVLEISRASDEKLGEALSAFNLMIKEDNGISYSVESAFQAGKCFEYGGPYTDLLGKSSRDAKKDERLRTSGNVIGFCFKEIKFPTEPKTFFYDWLYISALNMHPEFHEQLMTYDAFTDIMFTPGKMLNCQAEAAAIFASLKKCGLLGKALRSKNDFLETVFDKPAENMENEYIDITFDDL